MFEVDVDMKKGKNPQQAYLFGVIFIIAIFFLAGLILQLSWNASMPLAFSGAREISYLTALLLLIVAIILFGRKM